MIWLAGTNDNQPHCKNKQNEYLFGLEVIKLNESYIWDNCWAISISGPCCWTSFLIRLSTDFCCKLVTLSFHSYQLFPLPSLPVCTSLAMHVFTKSPHKKPLEKIEKLHEKLLICLHETGRCLKYQARCWEGKIAN